MTLDPTIATIGDLVAPRRSFMPSIDLDRAHEETYRAQCRDEYIYLPEDEVFFRNLANALIGQLAGGRRTIFEVGAYGAGKSLLDAVRGHLLAAPDDRVLLEKLRRSAFLYERFDQLVSEGPYLPIFVVGSQAAGAPIDSVIAEAIARALPASLSVESDHGRALEWIDGLAQRTELRREFQEALPTAEPVSPSGGAWSVDTLRRGLEAHHPAALVAFRDAQARAFRWPTSGFGTSRAVEILRDVHTAHVGAGRPYAGIVLFFDEFSQWVDTLPEGGRASAIATLQGLVEWVNRTNRVAMIISSQVRPALGDSYNALETLLTRTQEVAFDRSSYASFLAHVLERRIDRFEPVDGEPGWPALEAMHNQLFGSGPAAGARDYYPFHPGAVRALATLADQLGARERSVAQLLGADPDEEGGFGAFLQEPIFEGDAAGQRLRLFTLDRLFPYFAIRLREDHPQLYGRYEEIVVGESQPESLRTRIARVVVLSELLGPAFPEQPTAAGIAELLHLSERQPDVSAMLTELVSDALVVDAGERGYRVTSTGRISKRRLDREIERRVHELTSSGGSASSGDIARRLQHSEAWASEIWRKRQIRLASPAIARSTQSASGFEADYRVPITFAVHRTTLSEVADIARRAADGRGPRTPTIYVVVASEADADGEGLADAVAHARVIAAAGHCIGVPKQVARLVNQVIRVAAIESLAAEDAFGADELVGQFLLTAREALLKSMVEELDPAGYQWYIPGREAESVDLQTLLAAADLAASALASHLPHGIATDIGSDVKHEVASTLLLGGEIRLALDRTNKKPQQILHDGLAPIGLLQVEHRPNEAFRVARIVVPDPSLHPYTREIWDLFLEAVEGRRTLVSVVNALDRAPYMLPRNLGAYVLAAVLGYTGAHVVMDGGPAQRPQADLMRRLWDEPGRFEFVQARGYSPGQAAAALELAAIVASETPPNMRKALEKTELDDEMLVALRLGVARWHERVGRKASELAQELGIEWPGPLSQWLDLAAEIVDLEPGPLAASLAEVSNWSDPAADGVKVLSLAGLQADGLREVLADRVMLVQASQSGDPGVAIAWGGFARDPLADETREQVRTAVANSSRQTGSSVDPSDPGGSSTAATLPSAFVERILTTEDLGRLAAEIRLVAKAGESMTGGDLVRRLAAALGLDEAAP